MPKTCKFPHFSYLKCDKLLFFSSFISNFVGEYLTLMSPKKNYE